MGRELAENGIRRLLHADALIGDERCDLVADAIAHEIFALAGARDGAAAIAGIGAGADDRRIADAAGGLVGVAAGRGRGREMALGVARDRADRAVLLGLAGVRGRADQFA